jgi:hypothetical protein
MLSTGSFSPRPDAARPWLMGKDALFHPTLALRRIAHRDHLMTFPGLHIPSEKSVTEPTALPSPMSGGPSIENIAGLIHRADDLFTKTCGSRHNVVDPIRTSPW